jgi:hypothetical protein
MIRIAVAEGEVPRCGCESHALSLGGSARRETKSATISVAAIHRRHVDQAVAMNAKIRARLFE